jgi:hypothetical protein
MTLHSTEHPAPSRSRVHKARHLVKELRRLRHKVELAHELATSSDEAHWCLSVSDALDHLIIAGEVVLGGYADPRDTRRVRKRETELF